MKVNSRHVYGVAAGLAGVAILLAALPSIGASDNRRGAPRTRYSGAAVLTVPSESALEAAELTGGRASFFNAQAEASAGAAASEPPPSLVAIVGVRRGRVAYLSAGGAAPVKVSAGEVVGAWTVMRIGTDRVELDRAGQRASVKLFDRAQVQTAQPGPGGSSPFHTGAAAAPLPAPEAPG